MVTGSIPVGRTKPDGACDSDRRRLRSADALSGAPVVFASGQLQGRLRSADALSGAPQPCGVLDGSWKRLRSADAVPGRVVRQYAAGCKMNNGGGRSVGRSTGLGFQIGNAG